MKLVIDAHTASFYFPWSVFRFVGKYVMKRALVVLVSNQKVAELASTHYHVRPQILEDRIPNFKDGRIEAGQERGTGTIKRKNDAKLEEFKIAVIASFAPDEPIAEIMEAAVSLPEIKFHITGPKERARNLLTGKGRLDNVIFSGMSDSRTYVSLLQEMDCIMVLTKRDGTLLAGATEALALEKPLITSKWGPLQNYYSLGTVHIDNSPQQIRDAISKVRAQKTALGEEMRILRLQRSQEWERKFQEFIVLLNISTAKQQ